VHTKTAGISKIEAKKEKETSGIFMHDLF